MTEHDFHGHVVALTITVQETDKRMTKTVFNER